MTYRPRAILALTTAAALLMATMTIGPANPAIDWNDGNLRQSSQRLVTIGEMELFSVSTGNGVRIKPADWMRGRQKQAFPRGR